MPVYEFICNNCRKKFEVMKTIKAYDPKKVKCPKCNSKKVERLWSTVYTVTSKKS